MDLAGPLSRMAWDGYQRLYPDTGHDVLVPVPLHPKRLRKRGFNQSLLLAREFSQRKGAPGVPLVLPRALVRARSTATQAGLSLSEREANIKGAFVVVSPGKIKGMRLLLVDDVLTTGATARACARALMDAGALRVDVLTLARAVRMFGEGP
jgi:ComF family protein